VAKSLQILDEAPAVYAQADRLIEAADWVIWQLSSVETRNSCTAGYKALWSKREGFPSNDFYAALDQRFEDLVDSRMLRRISPLGECAGLVTADAAALTGLAPGTPVAVANVDAHVSAPAVTVVGPGRLVAVMGTSTCHIAVAADERPVRGFCGVVEDGVIPGLFGYEAGQTAVGDMFAWWVRTMSAGEDAPSVHERLEREAAGLRPGESGLIALDWWNGNRSILVDADLTGLLLGATLSTRPAEIYRALLEATAYGTRVIIETLEEAGLPVEEVVACGGLPFQNRLLMQLTADITGRRVLVAGSAQAPALGSAMFGAVAAGEGAGGHATITDAAAAMAHLGPGVYEPERGAASVYDEGYAIYRELHDALAREGSAMRRLRALQQRSRENRRA
jgi:L-ribulokinase